MNNRIMKFTYRSLFFVILIMFNACIEWGESLTFDIINNTDRMITVRQIGITCYTCPLDTTINLDIAEKISFSSYEDSGNAPDEPFREISKMIIIYNDTIQKEYLRNTDGKNPFNKDFYTETSRKESKRVTSITYEYSIDVNDFK